MYDQLLNRVRCHSSPFSSTTSLCSPKQGRNPPSDPTEKTSRQGKSLASNALPCVVDQEEGGSGGGK